MLATSLTAMADKPFELNLWDGKPKVKSADPNDTAKVFVYLPPKSMATGRAVVICPGGGYQHLAMDHEGKQVAEWLNQLGIAGIVLKYRMPHGKYEVPISDAEQAMRLVRANAHQWAINPNDIGIMGSSAGGHLASTIATHSVKDAKPNFQILFYPVITMMPSDAARLDCAKRRRPYRTARQRRELLSGLLQAGRSRFAPCLSHGRSRLGHAFLVQVSHRDAARTESLVAEFLRRGPTPCPSLNGGE